MSKYYYTIEAAEKVIKSDGSIESGSNVVSIERATESSAKKIGLKLLTRKDVYSVWIHKRVKNEDLDPIYQWSRYEDDKDWKGGAFWD